MSLARRLARLEVRNAPPENRLVVLPLDQWPAGDDPLAWDRIRAAHPQGRVFIPAQAVSPEEWEREARMKRQA